MSNLLDKPNLTTAEVAKILCTNDVVIRQSRVSGVLFDRPAPNFRKFGSRCGGVAASQQKAHSGSWVYSFPCLLPVKCADCHYF